jgi:hypothetical protein
MFITIYTRSAHWSLSRPKSMWSICFYGISLRSILGTTTTTPNLISPDEFSRNLILKAFIKMCQENPDLLKTGQNYCCTLLKDLSMFHCWKWHRYTKQSRSVNEIILGCLGSWRGISIRKYLHRMKNAHYNTCHHAFSLEYHYLLPLTQFSLYMP